MHETRRARWVGVLLAAVAAAGCGSAQESRTEVPAQQVDVAEESGFPREDGQTCANPGRSDINGDGHADAVVGERVSRDGRGGGRETYGDAGGIHVFYGTANGLSANGEGAPEDAVFRRGSEGVPGAAAEDDEWGEALAVADFDGDGCADVAVGAPAIAIDGSSEEVPGYAAGEVTILSGTPEGLSARAAQTLRQDDGSEPDDGILLVPGDREENDRFGAVLAAADFDGDGIADLAIASPGEARGENRIPKYTGCIDYYTPEEEAYCKRLAAEQAARPPVVPNLEQGAVSIVYGSRHGLGAGDRPARTVSQDDAFIGGEAENSDDFGHALTAGDFDGDGVADLAVSAPNERRPGAAENPSDSEAGLEPVIHVLPGTRGAGIGDRKAQTLSTADPGLPGPNDGSFGYALAAGDLDGDGADDLAVGAPYSDPDGGAVVVLYSAGAEGLSGQGAQRWTQASVGVADDDIGGGNFGAALTVGRFGGQGAEDLAVGMPHDTIEGEQDGSVTVLFGGPRGLSAGDARFLAWLTPRGENGDRVGSALSALPIRGPAFDDLLIGAPSAGENAGPTDSAGALVEVPTDETGPQHDAARRWRPDTPDVEGHPVRGGALGHSLG